MKQPQGVKQPQGDETAVGDETAARRLKQPQGDETLQQATQSRETNTTTAHHW